MEEMVPSRSTFPERMERYTWIMAKMMKHHMPIKCTRRTYGMPIRSFSGMNQR